MGRFVTRLRPEQKAANETMKRSCITERLNPERRMILPKVDDRREGSIDECSAVASVIFSFSLAPICAFEII
jgi:hypothetical protein